VVFDGFDSSVFPSMWREQQKAASYLRCRLVVFVDVEMDESVDLGRHQSLDFNQKFPYILFGFVLIFSFVFVNSSAYSVINIVVKCRTNSG
jgi:hypothetical protein